MAMNHASRVESSPDHLEADEAFLSIGEVARVFGVTLRALRFYEDRGLVKPHRVGNLRLYDRATRERIATILKAKKLGFTLTEILDLLERRSEPSVGTGLDLAPERVQTQLLALEQRRASLDEAIAELRRAAGLGPEPDRRRRDGSLAA